jgi:hypothetical protein
MATVRGKLCTPIHPRAMVALQVRGGQCELRVVRKYVFIYNMSTFFSALHVHTRTHAHETVAFEHPRAHDHRAVRSQKHL